MGMDTDTGMAARKTATLNEKRRLRFDMTHESKIMTEFNLSSLN